MGDGVVIKRSTDGSAGKEASYRSAPAPVTLEIRVPLYRFNLHLILALGVFMLLIGGFMVKEGLSLEPTQYADAAFLNVFGGILLAIGGVVTLSGLYSVIRRGVVTLTDETLSVRCSPLPPARRWTIARQALDRVEYSTTLRDASWTDRSGGTHSGTEAHYQVEALDLQGRKRTLVAVRSEAAAKRIVAELNRALGIE